MAAAVNAEPYDRSGACEQLVKALAALLEVLVVVAGDDARIALMLNDSGELVMRRDTLSVIMSQLVSS